MSSPEPTVIVEVPVKTHRSLQVLAAEEVYAVFHAGRPINLRVVQTLRDVTPRYRKTSFCTAGSAHLLARKLNRLFKTDAFAVYRLGGGEPVPPRDV